MTEIKNKNTFARVSKIDNTNEKATKILLVEDNSYDYQSFCYAFEEHAVNITWCKNSEEAWLLLEKNPDFFELVVCDYNLPMMTGLELSKRILEHKLPVPVVLLTGSGNENVAVDALKSGVDDYLIKDVKGHYLKTVPMKLSKIIRQFNDRLERTINEDKLAVASKVFANTTEAIIVTNPDNQIETVNQAFVDVTGYTAEEVIGKNPRFLSSDKHDPQFYQDMWKEIDTNGRWQGEIWNQKKNGDIFPEWLTINSIYDSTGKIMHYIGVFTDIGELKQAEKKLYQYAYYDILTKLPNRSSFLQSLQHEIVRNKRDQSKLALMFIDLDHFKWINDNLGHLLGDAYLKIVAERLSESIRESDIAARFAGDEFVVIFPQIKTTGDVAVISEKILSCFSETFMLGEQELSISASIGIAMFPEDGTDTDTLIKKADAAMYRSKQAGRHTYHFFTEDMQQAIEERMKRVSELQKAIKERQFKMLYQPFVDIKSGKIIGAEALVRWQHPSLGLQSPDSFISLAEQTGLIIPLGKLILETVCKQAKQWQDSGFQITEIAINLSKLQLKKLDFISDLKDIVIRSGVDTFCLTLEITETLMMDEQEKIIPLLQAIKNLGFKLSLDDFGTGYSSLSQIKYFPLDILKIPMPFVQDVTLDPHSATLAETIIKMGHSLNLQVVAEGIETEQQLSFLKQHQCNIGQGFLFSEGIQADEMSILLANDELY